MNEKYELKHISIFIKILLLFLVVFFSLYWIIANAYLNEQSYYREKIITSILSEIDFYLNDLDKSIAQI